MLPLYRCLLHLYPSEYRDEFGGEMIDVLRQARQALGGEDFVTRTLLCIRETAGLLLGALREHLRSFTGNYPEELHLPRRLDMRSEFRFPKSTAALMAVVLAVVLLTIEKAKGIQLTHSAAGSDVTIIWSILFSALAQMFLLVSIA